VTDERRRTERIAVEIPARLLLAGGREAAVTIRNVGELGVLVSVTDLEIGIHEGERALLEHPRLVDGHPDKALVRTPAAVVRVELDFDPGAITREVALYFDGGPRPSGVPA
jgi:hypothetical protein